MDRYALRPGRPHPSRPARILLDVVNIVSDLYQSAYPYPTCALWAAIIRPILKPARGIEPLSLLYESSIIAVILRGRLTYQAQS